MEKFSNLKDLQVYLVKLQKKNKKEVKDILNYLLEIAKQDIEDNLELELYKNDLRVIQSYIDKNDIASALYHLNGLLPDIMDSFDDYKKEDN